MRIEQNSRIFYNWCLIIHITEFLSRRSACHPVYSNMSCYLLKDIALQANWNLSKIPPYRPEFKLDHCIPNRQFNPNFFRFARIFCYHDFKSGDKLQQDPRAKERSADLMVVTHVKSFIAVVIDGCSFKGSREQLILLLFWFGFFIWVFFFCISRKLTIAVDVW